MTDDNLPAGTTVWVFGDQLNRRIGALGIARPETHRILFVEATEQIAGRRYHRQRLHMVVAGMRRLSVELRMAEAFIDGAEWVMLPNVIGMALASNHRMQQPLRGLQRLPDVAAVRARASEVLSRLDAGEL